MLCKSYEYFITMFSKCTLTNIYFILHFLNYILVNANIYFIFSKNHHSSCHTCTANVFTYISVIPVLLLCLHIFQLASGFFTAFLQHSFLLS